MALRTRAQLAAAKIETTSGTPETFAGADTSFAAYNPTYSPNFETEPDDSPDTSLSSGQESVTLITSDIGFSTDLIGGASPFWATELMRLVGFSFAAGTMTPSTAEASTGTVGVYQEGLLKRITGAQANLTVNMQVKQRLRGQFDFRGSHVAPVDQAAPTGRTLPADKGPKVQSIVATIGGNSFCFASATLTIDNSLEDIECATAANGILSTSRTARRVTLSLDPEATTVAVRDDYGLAAAETVQPVVLAIGTAGNRVTFTIPRAQRIDVQDGNRSSIITHELNLLAVADAGDDEITIAVD